MNDRCSINDDRCSAPGGRIVGGLCITHYQRRNLHGDPLVFTGSPILHLPGELNPNHKVTAEQVGEIRVLREADPQT